MVKKLLVKYRAKRDFSKTAEPSGFFTNRKSEQIEKDLGGGF